MRRFWRRIQCRPVLAGVCAALLGSVALSAGAQSDTAVDAPSNGNVLVPEKVFEVTVGLSASHDTNLFRDPGLLRNTESENLSTGYVGLRIDKPYAQQRFFLDATATAYRYDKFSYLDFNGLNYRAAWYWYLTPRFNGTLSAARSESPTQFQDTFGRQSNVAINETYAFDLVGSLFAGWHALLGLSQANRSSEQTSLQQQPDFSERRAEAGVRYLFRSGNSINAVWRRIDGNQDSQVIGGAVIESSEDYKEDQSEIRANWIVTQKSSLAARFAYVDRRYDRAPQNDFSGPVGDLSYSWNPVAKLGLRLSAARSITPFQGGLSANYRVRNTVSIAPTWEATAKMVVYLNLQRAYDEYPRTIALAERDDTTDRLELGVNWQGLRRLSVGASVFREQRSSNNPLVEYETTVGRLNAALIF